MYKWIKKIFIVSIVLCVIFSFSVYSDESDFYGSKTEKDLEDVIFAFKMGSHGGEITEQNHPNANIQYFNDFSDVLAAMKVGKIDVTAAEETIFYSVHKTDNNVKRFENPFYYCEQAFILSNKFCKEDNNTLLTEINEYIKKSKENGFIDGLMDKWGFNYDENVKYENIKVNNPKKKLNVVLSSSPPYSFVKDRKYAGFDVEFFENFCKEYNYDYKYELVDFGSVIMGVASGKYDIGIGAITITEERKKNMTFTESHYTEPSLYIYYEKSTNQFLIDKIKKSFYNSFIKEDRYKLIIRGLCITLFITIASTIIGILIGFLMYLLYMSGVKIFNILIDIYVYIMNGLPLVVFLMILYYIIFSGADISGAMISVVGFSFVMGIFIFASLVSYTNIIDVGQVEAALALGYTKKEAFKKIIVPQIVNNIFPPFKNRVVLLLKNTAIVGYIAVADLTRAGDIIRSRTYEAIFPLLSIALIYFIVGGVLKIILSVIEKKINYKNRTKEQILNEIVGKNILDENV